MESIRTYNAAISSTDRAQLDQRRKSTKPPYAKLMPAEDGLHLQASSNCRHIASSDGTFRELPNSVAVATPARPTAAPLSSSTPLSNLELLLLWSVACSIFLLVLTHFQTYAAQVDAFGDNLSYLAAAKGIQHWQFQGVNVKQFWGLPYLIAGFSWAHLPLRSILLMISMLSSLGSMFLARRLWGLWIAAFFVMCNFTWLQLSFLGGAEPLFVLLLFPVFLMARKQNWIAASILASFATLVRPLGIFALLGIGLYLLGRKDYKKALLCTAIAILIGGLYLLPFAIYFHDPLYQVHQYKQADWQSGPAIGWPFRAMLISLVHNREPWTNVVFTCGWIIFAALGLGRMLAKDFRHRFRNSSPETIFALSCLIFLFCYNSVHWARADFPRFVIPVVPFLLLAFDRWLPRSRYVIFGLCVVSSVLGACSALGIRNVVTALL